MLSCLSQSPSLARVQTHGLVHDRQTLYCWHTPLVLDLWRQGLSLSQIGFELAVCLPLPFECWGYRCMPPLYALCPAFDQSKNRKLCLEETLQWSNFTNSKLFLTYLKSKMNPISRNLPFRTHDYVFSDFLDT